MAAHAKTILVADDEESIRTALRRAFTRRGWEVFEACDGDQALSLIRSQDTQPFTVVLSDLQMPGLSGAQLYDRLAAERPDTATRMIFSSGDIFSTEAQELASRSGRPLLQKPFDLGHLVDLAESMQSHRTGQAP